MSGEDATRMRVERLAELLAGKGAVLDTALIDVGTPSHTSEETIAFVVGVLNDLSTHLLPVPPGGWAYSSVTLTLGHPATEEIITGRLSRSGEQMQATVAVVVPAPPLAPIHPDDPAAPRS